MFKNYITRENIGYRFFQLLILIAHLILLAWIIYTLYEGGILPFKTLMFHFIGMSVYGGLLIRITAYITKRHYLKEVERYARTQQLED